MVIVLLAGCSAVSAAGGTTQSAAAGAPTVSTAEAQQGWVTAADVTVTPAPGTPTPGAQADNSTATAAQAQAGAAVQFTGNVTATPGSSNWQGAWQIGGHTVYVSPSTIVDQQHGTLGQGAQVEVEGWSRPDGSVDAGWIHVLSGAPAGTPAPNFSGSNVTPAASSGATATPAPGNGATATPAPANAQGEEPENKDQQEESENNDNSQAANQNNGRRVVFRGIVESLPDSGLVGTWRVSGRDVHVAAGTRIRQQQWPLVQGALVQIIGWQQPDGSIDAASIDTKNPRSAGGPEHPGNNGNGNGNGKGNGNGRGNGNGHGNGKGNGGGD